MCLIYKAPLPPEPVENTFTAYKVYVAYQPSNPESRFYPKALASPIYDKYPNGEIFKPGMYEAATEEYAIFARSHNSGLGNKITPKIPLNEEHKDMVFHISGFHCILKKAEAIEYLNYLSFNSKQLDNPARGLAAPEEKPTIKKFTLVKVKIDKRDIIAYGQTKMQDIKLGQRVDRHTEINTVVVKYINISPKEFENAFKGNS